MTLALERPVLQPSGDVWTVDDIERLPRVGRYEIVNGSLLVTPPPPPPHVYANHMLLKRLMAWAPPDVEVVTAGAGVHLPEHTVYVPDLVIIPKERLREVLTPSDILLVVEVLSPSNARNDLVRKRRDYADVKMAPYWIVDNLDPEKKTLIVLDRPEHGDYTDETAVKAGAVWRTDRPFALELDPGLL